MDLHRQAVNTGLAFLQAQSARGLSTERRRRDQDFIITLRNSLQYRSDAMVWHASLLGVLQDAAVRRLRAAFPNQGAEYDLLMLTSNEQHYAFDDLVFNATALFDYVANLIGFGLHGEQRWKAKWDRIQKYARDRAFEERENRVARVATGRIGPRMLEAHSRLVSDLAEYRHTLIHQEALVGKAHGRVVFPGPTDTPPSVGYVLNVTVPSAFAKRFVVPGYEADPTQAPILEAAQWIATRVNTEVADLLRELERDLRSEVGLDPDGTDIHIMAV